MSSSRKKVGDMTEAEAQAHRDKKRLQRIKTDTKKEVYEDKNKKYRGWSDRQKDDEIASLVNARYEAYQRGDRFGKDEKTSQDHAARKLLYDNMTDRFRARTLSERAYTICLDPSSYRADRDADLNEQLRSVLGAYATTLESVGEGKAKDDRWVGLQSLYAFLAPASTQKAPKPPAPPAGTFVESDYSDKVYDHHEMSDFHRSQRRGKGVATAFQAEMGAPGASGSTSYGGGYSAPGPSTAYGGGGGGAAGQKRQASGQPADGPPDRSNRTVPVMEPPKTTVREYGSGRVEETSAQREARKDDRAELKRLAEAELDRTARHLFNDPDKWKSAKDSPRKALDRFFHKHKELLYAAPEWARPGGEEIGAVDRAARRYMASHLPTSAFHASAGAAGPATQNMGGGPGPGPDNYGSSGDPSFDQYMRDAMRDYGGSR